MIETVKKLLIDKYQYELEEYALYVNNRCKNKVIPFTTILFVIFSILYVLDVTNTFINFMNLPILMFMIVVLVMVPIAFKKGNKYEAIIVTPKFLIQRVSKSQYVVIEFDEITGYKIDKDGIHINENKNKIILGMGLIEEEIDPIIDILEAKGKTFDSKKDFMVRPINIIIEDNKVTIEDDVRETASQRLYKRYDKKYEVLTPGFIHEIIFRNSKIEDAKVSVGSLVLYLNGFEVKGGHPENTKFENLFASDGILIFEKIVFDKVVLRDLNKDNPDKLLKVGVKGILKYLDKAVISEWKSQGDIMEMIFATGVYQLRTTFTYEEVFVGWNIVK